MKYPLIDAHTCNTIVMPAARHEAGHYIAARVLGFGAGPMSIIVPVAGGHRAKTIVELAVPLRGNDAVIDYMERRVQVLFAGSLAEALATNGSVDNEHAAHVLSTEGESDDEKAGELMRIIRNIKYPQAATAKAVQKSFDMVNNELWHAATALVEREAQLIHILSTLLAAKVKTFGRTFQLTNDEINALTAIQERFVRAVAK